MRERHHPQTIFITHEGKRVKVDEELVDILNVLRDLGVRTQHSCQGTQDEMCGYILADRKSFRPVLKKIYKAYKQDLLWTSHWTLVRAFLGGYRRYEVSHYIGKKPERQVFHFLTEKGEDTIRDGYALEFTNSLRYGRRITVRFPNDMIPLIYDLLIHI